MAQVFRLPRIGDSFADGVIQEWNVDIGDSIGRDQVICSIETSKAVVDVPCPYDGVVLHLGGAVGDTIELDDILIVVGEAGERWPGEDSDQAVASMPTEQPKDSVVDDSVQIFRLPRVGDAMSDAIIQTWLVKVGDKVAKDEVVCEAETSKAVVEIPCPYEGHVLHLGAAEGETVELDEILIVVGDEGASWSPDLVAQATESTGDTAGEQTQQTPGTPTITGRGGIRAMPKVRKLARELGIDLSGIIASGPDGNITSADLHTATRKPEAPATSSKGIFQPAAGVAIRRERLTGMRRAIADNLMKSAAHIPHASMEWEIDFTNVLGYRKKIIDKTGEKITVDALLIHAVAPLLREFPELNSYVDGDEIVYYEDINVGMAIGAKEGLLVPVIRNADNLTILEISAEIARLANAAQTRSITPDDLSGLTVTVSNVGGTGAAWGGASIIPGGTAAMLSAGRALKRPVVVDDEIVARPIVRFIMTYDHRAFDGAHVAAFFRQLKEALEGAGE